MEVRKTVTVLFSDWVSSTALGERLDPETLRSVQSRWFGVAEDVLVHHGGTVEKFIGDAVMAVFGLPDAHEDDGLRAVRAAVRMRELLAALNDDLERELGIRLALRTGITTGEAVTGDATLRQSLVTGDVVNTAKRLEEAAPPDEILVGQATHDLVATARPSSGLLTWLRRESGSMSRRGASSTSICDAPGIARRLDTPLVGRAQDLVRLERAVERARRERRALVATVVGPAGIGKSRLVRELVDGLGETTRVLAGKCVAYGGTTYRPLVEILRDAGGPDGVARVLGDQEDARLVVERLDAAVGVSPASFPTDEIFWAVRRFVEQSGRELPLVLVVDDAHWAEATFHDLVDYLAAFVDDAPVTIVRPRSSGADRGTRRATPTSSSSSSRCPTGTPESSSGVAGAPAGLTDRIVAIAEGNPLFLEQLAAVAAGSESDEMRIPATIDAVLAARLDQLPAGQLAILERGSVVGRRFETQVLIELLDPETRSVVTSALLALTRAGLVRPAPGPTGRDRYRFAHGLVRDAAYARIPKTTRAELHETLARRLLRDEHRGPNADDLAGHHLEQASHALRELGRSDPATVALAEEAAALLQEAGRRAGARDDIPAAIALFERAESLVEHAESTLLGSIRHGLGRGLWEIGANERALQVLETAIEDAVRAGDARTEWVARARPFGVPARSRDVQRPAGRGGAGRRGADADGRRRCACARVAADGVRRPAGRPVRSVRRAVGPRPRARARSRRRVRGDPCRGQPLHRTALRPDTGRRGRDPGAARCWPAQTALRSRRTSSRRSPSSRRCSAMSKPPGRPTPARERSTRNWGSGCRSRA